MRFKLIIALLSVSLFFTTACDKTTIEDFETEDLNAFLPAIKGKYITYRLDSTVFTNFGRNIEVHKYQVKHEIDSLITDNIGRPSYRVFRYLRDSAGNQPWVPNGTYFLTHLDKQVEVIEENLRFIKLHQPFRLGYNWKGNKYLSTEPYSSKFSFSNDDNMNDWDYTFEQFDPSIMIGTKTVNNVYTILHIDESVNAPVRDVNAYGARNLSIEKYAKDIGLVWREYVLWEYQPPANGVSGFYTGFGIKMWMIDYN